MHNEVRGQLERYSSPSAMARALAQAALPTEWPCSPFSLQRLVPEAHLGLFMLLFKIEYLDLTCQVCENWYSKKQGAISITF